MTVFVSLKVWDFVQKLDYFVGDSSQLAAELLLLLCSLLSLNSGFVL